MQNALLSALPYLVMWILSLVAAQFADLTARKGWASTNVIRKTANSVGMFWCRVPPSGACYTFHSSVKLPQQAFLIFISLLKTHEH